MARKTGLANRKNYAFKASCMMVGWYLGRHKQQFFTILLINSLLEFINSLSALVNDFSTDSYKALFSSIWVHGCTFPRLPETLDQTTTTRGNIVFLGPWPAIQLNSKTHRSFFQKSPSPHFLDLESAVLYENQRMQFFLLTSLTQQMGGPHKLSIASSRGTHLVAFYNLIQNLALSYTVEEKDWKNNYAHSSRQSWSKFREVITKSYHHTANLVFTSR